MEITEWRAHRRQNESESEIHFQLGILLMKFIYGLILSLLLGVSALAQNAPPPSPAATSNAAVAKDEISNIEDNSFLIEEAYNQERNVIQHISSFTRLWESKDWAYSFTQEWPFPGHEKHQLSYTVTAVNSGAFPANGPGFGDTALNYRYQLVGGGGQKFAFSPRVSMLVPTGSARFGRGYGGVGVQTNLPLSVYLHRKLVTHWNAGATIIPRARNEFGDRALATGYNLGQSFIWLAKPRFNVMLETVWAGSESVIAKDHTQRSHNLLVSPGIRWAYNFNNGLQIVPGIAVPIGAGPSAGEKGLIVYLSFEHPIGPTDKK
jgi:hypothetical protein